jgi:hypothetical protein
VYGAEVDGERVQYHSIPKDSVLKKEWLTKIRRDEDKTFLVSNDNLYLYEEIP